MVAKYSLYIATISLSMISLASGAVIFDETFDSATLGPTSTPGDTYNGDESWLIADGNTGGNDTSFSVNTGIGWDGNDAGGNQYLFADSAGSVVSADSNNFRAVGWNTNSDTILSITFDFALEVNDPDPDDARWGAFIMSANSTLTATDAAGAPDQQVHVRFEKDGDVVSQNNSILGADAINLGVNNINTFALLYNGSADTFDGVDSGNARLSINGSVIEDNFDVGHAGNTDGPVTLNYLEFRSFGTLDNGADGVDQAYFDSVVVNAIDPIPEPTTAGLLGLAGLALLKRGRSERRA